MPLRVGQNKLTSKPAITRPAAKIFQVGSGSLKKKADAPIPKMGTNRGAGATSAAGCFESNHPQAVYPNKVLPQDCHSTPSQAPIGAEAIEVHRVSQPPSTKKEITNKGGMANALAQTTYENILIDPARRLVVLAIPQQKPANTTKARPKTVVEASVCTAIITRPIIAMVTATIW